MSQNKNNYFFLRHRNIFARHEKKFQWNHQIGYRLTENLHKTFDANKRPEPRGKREKLEFQLNSRQSRTWATLLPPKRRFGWRGRKIIILLTAGHEHDDVSYYGFSIESDGCRFLNKFSISCRVFPFVSGSIWWTKIVPSKETIPKNRNIMPFPIQLSIDGYDLMTMKDMK